MANQNLIPDIFTSCNTANLRDLGFSIRSVFGHYAVSSGKQIPTFRRSVLCPYSRTISQ